VCWACRLCILRCQNRRCHNTGSLWAVRATRGPAPRDEFAMGLGASCGSWGKRKRPLPNGFSTPIRVGTMIRLVSESVGKRNSQPLCDCIQLTLRNIPLTIVRLKIKCVPFISWTQTPTEWKSALRHCHKVNTNPAHARGSGVGVSVKGSGIVRVPICLLSGQIVFRHVHALYTPHLSSRFA
jgi:hypothetical protein